MECSYDHIIMIHMVPMIVLLLLTQACDCQRQIFYIRPSDSSHCPQEVNASQCYDLTTLVSEGHLSTATNTSLLFLPGEHFLEQDLDIINIEEFQMIAYYDRESIKRVSGVRITCSGTGYSIRIHNVSFLRINSLSFQSCGVDMDSYGSLQLRSVDHSEITNCKWYESRSSAIFIEDSNSVISDCQFMGGNCSNCSGGGIQAVSSNVTLTGSNVVTDNSVLMGNGGGLSLTSSTVQVDGNLTVNSNLARISGGGIFIKNCTFLTLSCNNTLSDRGQPITTSQGNFNGYYGVGLFGNSAHDGGGMYIDESNSTFNGHVEVSGNSATYEGGGMFVGYNSHCTFNGHVEFSGNSADLSGGGMSVRYNSHCTFNGHVEFSGNSGAYYGGGISVKYNSHCTFNGHVEFSGNSADYDGGGMSVGYNSHCTFNGHVEFSGNSADYDGGGMSVGYNSHCTFNEHVEFSGNNASYGGGICIMYDSNSIFNGHANFAGNSASAGGGSLLSQQNSSINFLSLVNISSSTAGREGGGIFVRDDSLLEMRGEVIMQDNNASSYGGAISLEFSKLEIDGNNSVTSNSAHYGGAIHATSSKLYLSGVHYFASNSAKFGGGLALSGSSLQLKISIKLNIQFVSNHAEQYGGAIWVENIPYYSCTNFNDLRCFFAFLGTSLSLYRDHHRITSSNNTAIAGSFIYGGNFDACSMMLFKDFNFLKKIQSNLTSDFVYDLMPFLNESNSISSDPKQVCLCKHNEPDCSISVHKIEAFSGQQFPLRLVGVGERNGTVPAVILSETDPAGSSNNGSVTQSATNSCSELFYTITSDKPSVQLMLYPQSAQMCPKIHMLIIKINIKPCPPGFMLDDVTKVCVCDNTLKELDNTIQCDIVRDPQVFSHQHGVWIGYDQLNNSTETVIYHPHCPFDYCKQEQSTFTLNSADNQCRYNRSGFLCGACSGGYSLTLGGSKCKECSNVYLMLFIPLALAGVVLVLFLFAFKLTISMGTIDGFIFFTNIIGTNSSIFLPPESTVVLRVFIAWLNLDLGIDTCLFDGLDEYIKVWLQFVFPFYVFILIFILIFISQCSTLVTRLLGNDPVAVLATLILLAYTKLFRAVLAVMSFTYIRGFDGSSVAVWLYDGNVKYMSGKHIALVMFALLITLLLIIPYTVILLFAPYLQRHSKNRVLCWINDYRLKSFLDSYYAPLKNKYRSWIGLLLILRLCLLIVFVSNSLGDPSINLLAITVAVILLICCRAFFGTIYTNWCHDALELFFIMKLGLFSVATLYILHTGGNQRALADTLVGVAFIVFVAITVYHGWRQLTDSRWWRLTLKPKWQKYFNSKNAEDIIDEEDSEKCIEPPQVSTTFIELREPLLDAC